MRRIYDFGRRPAQRNYTVSDLQALKGSGKRLSMCNPNDATELQACIDAGIDLLTIGMDVTEAREIAPTHFIGTGMTWAQFGTPDEILSHAIEDMRNGSDMYYTLRS